MKSRLIKNSCDGYWDSCLDIRFTKACDNNCAFCIEKSGVASMGKTDTTQMIKSTIDSGYKSVLILGGEPFLYPEDLKNYVLGIRNHVDKIYITTSLPPTLDLQSTHIKEILGLIDGLNVSLQHFNWRVNNDILEASSRHDRISQLKGLLKYKDMPKKIRVSINLVEKCIDSKFLLLETLDMLKGMGVEHVKVNELQHSSENYISCEKIMGWRLKSAFAHGCQTDASELFDIPGLKVTLKRSCFITEPTLKASLADVCKAFLKATFPRYFVSNKPMKVLYENGAIKDGWLKEDSK